MDRTILPLILVGEWLLIGRAATAHAAVANVSAPAQYCQKGFFNSQFKSQSIVHKDQRAYLASAEHQESGACHDQFL